ncbi:HugZ family pyridoxamine 5'-phosphate oxidase [Algicola sagamiensis]|uniref:HugZ family pyridoxamine 5'-phosphate oxidase n=1 Tax=Algicola sagamiensis TaxID=163869 RepID=UPI000378DCC2|nr:DUF2470 domain-containing protein [Algicola sagamiensis]
MKIEEISFEAKHLVRHVDSGVLSTISVSVEGYPFGSVTPYIMTDEGDLIIYISDLAQHTKNIATNPKVSMTIFDGSKDDSQANGRVTVLGDAVRLTKEEGDALKEEYFALFPQARAYEKAHDFFFFRITPVRVRYIGGFGRIHWVNKEYWSTEPAEFTSSRTGIITHMNEDHVDAMVDIVKMQFGKTEEKLEMVSCFAEGCHFRGQHDVYFIPFSLPVHSSADVRAALVELAKRARASLVA